MVGFLQMAPVRRVLLDLNDRRSTGCQSKE
jgi:hypothetical protein